jgi:hypothetical protein
MANSQVDVFFVYKRSSGYLGSTQMRGFQLCEILQRFGSGRFRYAMKPIPTMHWRPFGSLWSQRQRREAVYVFVKDAIDRLDGEALGILHRRAAAVVHDPIDRDIGDTPPRHVDLHLATSCVQYDALCERLAGQGTAVGLLLHQPDLRLSEPPDLPVDTLRPAYFGNPINAFLPEPVAARVPLVDVGLTEGMDALWHRFGSANFHYAVRPADQVGHPTVFKPLTKATTAAVCGAPIMVNRDADDAVALLGGDYPYLVDQIETEAVLEVLDRAASGFGGAEWAFAIDKMGALAARVSPRETALTFERLLETVL